MDRVRDVRAVILLTLILALTVGWCKTETVTCVYQSWSGVRGLYGNLMGDEIPAELCTHAVYAYASIYENKIFNQLPSLDEYTSGGAGNIAKFVSLKRRNPTLKALIGVGGWTAGGWIFSKMVTTAEGRQTFIQSVIDFCTTYQLDGVFLDWLYPGVAVRGGSPDDGSNFASLLTEMKSAFDDAAATAKTTKLFIGVTVSPSPDYFANYSPTELNSAADLVYIISYDLAGWWNGTISHPSPLFTEDGSLSVDSSVQLWKDAGISPGKLVIGIPTFSRTYKVPNNTAAADTYGQTFSGDGLKGPVTSAPGFLVYSETCTRIELAGYTVVRDPIMKVSYAYSTDQVIMYDDEISVKDKAEYAKANRLSGVYIFSTDQDDVKGFCGPPFPLTRAAASVLLPAAARLRSSNMGAKSVQNEQRCVSATKSCTSNVKCVLFMSRSSAENATTEVCAKDLPCVQPISVVECPVPESVTVANKNLFNEKSKSAASAVFISGGSNGSSATAVQCRGGVVSSSNGGKDKGVFYTCSDHGLLGRGVQEYTCPAGSKYSAVYLKCVLGGK